MSSAVKKDIHSGDNFLGAYDWGIIGTCICKRHVCVHCGHVMRELDDQPDWHYWNGIYCPICYAKIGDRIDALTEAENALEQLVEKERSAWGKLCRRI